MIASIQQQTGHAISTLEQGSKLWMVIMANPLTPLVEGFKYAFLGQGYFSWLALGYSQTDTPLGQLAPYGGVFSLGWAVLLSAGLLWTLINSATWRARLRWRWH